MKRFSVLVSFGLLSVLLASSVPTAMAQPPDVPESVTGWFKSVAPAVVRSQSLPSQDATSKPDDHYIYPFNSEVGRPIPVMVWRDTFLTAKTATVNLLEFRGDYIAPISSQGRGVGTLIAEILKDGSWGYRWDDDAQTAAALMDVGPKEVVASDALNGVFIIAGDQVTQYGLGKSTIPGVGTVAQLQAALLAQRADYEQQVAAAGGEELTGSSPINFGQFVSEHPVVQAGANVWWVVTLFGCVLVLGIGVGFFARRRSLISKGQ